MVPVFESPYIGAELVDDFFIITANRTRLFLSKPLLLWVFQFTG